MCIRNTNCTKIIFSIKEIENRWNPMNDKEIIGWLIALKFNHINPLAVPYMGV